MHIIKTCVALAIVAAVPSLRSASAQDILNQDWALNPTQSHVYLQTEKLQGVVEKHEFTSVGGNVSRNGDASIKIDLNKLETGIDLRNVRMRFLLFETFKFPALEITAKLDKSKLASLTSSSRLSYSLMAHVNLHGVVKDIEIPVTVVRVNDTITVSTIKPVVVGVDAFDFAKGLAKLADAVQGIRIVPEASVTFDLTFVTGSAAAAVAAARVESDKATAREAVAVISTEGCEARFTVITESNAIYFRTGSAELDSGSEPLLDTGADIAKRCPSVTFDVEGHTDSTGGQRYNQGLSERRAQSVVAYLTAKGVTASRVHAAGYGQTRPVAANTSEEGRAKNRRIEFKVHKD